MNTATADPGTFLGNRQRRSILMVFCCTILGAGAQMFFKAGLKLSPHLTLATIVTNWPLILGLALYGGSTILLVLALREGELSLLYPVISLTYAWVTILSIFWLGETFNVFKGFGLAAIIGTLQAFTRAGDHVLLCDNVYGPGARYCRTVLSRFGVETGFLPPDVGAEVEQYLKPNTRLILLESPGSNTLELQDLPAVTAVARRRGRRSPGSPRP